MNEAVQSFLYNILEVSAGLANILLVAKSVGLPMTTSEELVKSSSLTAFIFLFAFALSVTHAIPALIATALYFVLERDSIVRQLYKKASSSTHTSKARGMVLRGR
jgi:hypothetical protein